MKGTKKRVAGAIFLFALIIASVYIIRNDAEPSYISLSGQAFGTTWTIVYQPKSSKQDIESLVIETMQTMDASLSAFNPDSRLSQINKGTTDELDSLLEQCLSIGLRVAKETSGAFDPTIGAVVDKWGFGPVSDIDTTGLAASVGYNNLSIADHKLRKSRAGTQIDLSGVAKGFAVDRVGAALEGAGIKNYLVEIGGEIFCRGKSPSDDYWNIGICKPERGATGALLTMAATDVGIATSGNYRNYHEHGDTVIGHIVSPFTLQPAASQTISSTVVAADCATADAWATALMVFSPAETQTLIMEHEELQALIVYRDSVGEQHIWSTDSLHKTIVAVAQDL